MPKYRLTKPRFLEDNRRYPGRGEVVTSDRPPGEGMELVDEPKAAPKARRKPKSKSKAAKPRKGR